jgi:CRISPR-associated protein Cmr3
MPLAELGPGISAGAELPWVPVLPSPKPVKPRHGCWLTADGLGRYLDGGTPEPGHVVHEAQLWASDPRLGIALDGGSRTAARGMIYTAETVALRPEVSFVVGVDGVPEPLLPRDGLVRLGGDGRGARLEPCTIAAPWSARPAQRYFTITLATLGLFPRGWLLPGVHRAGEGLELRIEGLRARLLAATVPRFEVVSGWDLALHRPKPAQRASPRGSTYFFEVGHGDPGCLEQLVNEGLWPLLASEMEGDDGAGSAWLQRKAEGFNNVWVGSWCPARPAA